MDYYLRQIYFSAALILAVLWTGMLFWFFGEVKPSFSFSKSVARENMSFPGRDWEDIKRNVLFQNQGISPKLSQARSEFQKPTTGRFADGFGERIHPLTGKKSFHAGLDLAPGWRAQVVASQSGRVDVAGKRSGYGQLIILDHGDGLSSWYAHLDEILVKPGQMVKKGELIGKVGKTGRVTGPHLHFEVRKHDRPQNPLLYLIQ